MYIAIYLKFHFHKHKIYIVATVRFEEPEYTFQENSGTGEVCLIKDLATPDSVTVQVPTTDITATGKPH